MLMELLENLPRERWANQKQFGVNLLHHACNGANLAAVVVLLQSGLIDVSERNRWGGYTAAHYAAARMQPRSLEALCAVGADMRVLSNHGEAPVEIALGKDRDGGESVRVLVANGVRLSTVDGYYRNHITPELEAFEHGVLCCRVAVAVVLSVKRKGNLWRWDKFLLREVAYAVWATRYDEKWSF